MRKVPRSNGFACEFRFYDADTDGNRCERDGPDLRFIVVRDGVRRPKGRRRPDVSADEGTVVARVEMAFGNLITKHLTEVLPELKHSTQDTNRSVIGLHIKPQWEVYRFADIEAYDVDRWISSGIWAGVEVGSGSDEAPFCRRCSGNDGPLAATP